MLSVFQKGDITFARGYLGGGHLTAAYHPKAGLQVGTETILMTLRKWRPGTLSGDFVARRVGHAITWHLDPDAWTNEILPRQGGPARSGDMLWPIRIGYRPTFGLFHYENTDMARAKSRMATVKATGIDTFQITRDADGLIERLCHGQPVDAILIGRKETPLELRIDLSRKEN